MWVVGTFGIDGRFFRLLRQRLVPEGCGSCRSASEPLLNFRIYAEEWIEQFQEHCEEGKMPVVIRYHRQNMVFLTAGEV
jgi:hypothetical protein